MHNLTRRIISEVYENFYFTEGYNEDRSGVVNLVEKLITFGPSAYPKSGHVVLLAGGAGSGKGFVKDMLLGIEGKVFDVDALKAMMLKKPEYLAELEKTIKQFHADGLIKTIPNVYDERVRATMFKDPKMVEAMHFTVERLGLPKRIEATFFNAIMNKPADKKPNLIFDVTLKSITRLHNLTTLLAGYDPKNIHLVWILNDIEIAKKQNLKRARVVPEDILVDTHVGAARTFADIIKMGEELKNYLDGRIVIVPNKSGVDNVLKKSEHGGYYFEKADYIVIKEPGKSVNKAAISAQLERKIKEYTPAGSFDLSVHGAK